MISRRRTRRLVLGLALAVAVIAADQATKSWALGFFSEGPRALEVTSFFSLVLIENRGISFGLFDTASPAAPWILTGVALAIVAGLVVWLARVRESSLAIGLGLIIGGALGNTLDRMSLGAVTDFLLFHYREYAFPAFNLADASITIGVGFLLWDALFGHRESPISKG